MRDDLTAIAGRIGQSAGGESIEGVWCVNGCVDRRRSQPEGSATPWYSVVRPQQALVLRYRAGEAGWLTAAAFREPGAAWSMDCVDAAQGWSETMLATLAAMLTRPIPRASRRPASTKDLPWAVRVERLSPTERRVLAGLAKGFTERQIAGELRRSPNTVHVHVKSIYLKLGVNGRDDLLANIKQHKIDHAALKAVDHSANNHDNPPDTFAAMG